MNIRTLHRDDWRALHRLCTDPLVVPWLDEVPFQPAEVFRHRLEQLNSAAARALAAEDGDEVVGALVLEISPVRRRTHCATLWLAVLPEHQRKGVGAALLESAVGAADRWLNLVRLDAEIDADNVAGLALLERQGFQVETHKRCARLRDGKPVELVQVARLRPGAERPRPSVARAPDVQPARPNLPVRPTIRASRFEDAEALARIHSETSVMWGTMQLPYTALEVWKQRLEGNAATPEFRHVLVAEVGGRTCGMLGLFGQASQRRNKVYHLGMSVEAEFQGSGIGNALMTAGLDLAQRWLGAWRVELEVYTDNARAIALYQKHGFEREGIKRSDAWRDGAFVDSLIMARLFV